MDVKEAIENRRAIKHYDPDHEMSEAEIRELMELTLQAPTAFNIQHWRFVLVRDAELRQQIRAHAWDQAQVTEASLLVVLCGKLTAWEDDPARYWVHAPQGVQDFLVPAIRNYYAGNEEVQRDEVMRSCGIAGQTLMLAAQEMGYDSCPMDGFNFAEVGKLIGLPEDHVISFMVAVGKGTQPAWPKPGQLPYEEVVLTDRFGG